MPEKCYSCLTSKCELHSNDTKDFDFEIFLISIYREELQRSHFTKHVLSNDLDVPVKEENVLVHEYFKEASKYGFQTYKKTKNTSDFDRNYDHLHKSEDSVPLIQQVLRIVMDKKYANTTFICQDSDSTTFVSYSENKTYKNYVFATRALNVHVSEIRVFGMDFRIST